MKKNPSSPNKEVITNVADVKVTSGMDNFVSVNTYCIHFGLLLLNPTLVL